ncbi:MAG: hypothetical protein E7046_14370, partial [Lentisphaerae bacterium]|nr:hypothetical protein [Lentisphaerota bacterium]
MGLVPVRHDCRFVLLVRQHPDHAHDAVNAGNDRCTRAASGRLHLGNLVAGDDRIRIQVYPLVEMRVVSADAPEIRHAQHRSVHRHHGAPERLVERRAGRVVRARPAVAVLPEPAVVLEQRIIDIDEAVCREILERLPARARAVIRLGRDVRARVGAI